jgi:hypothetical protein
MVWIALDQLNILLPEPRRHFRDEYIERVPGGQGFVRVV